VSNAIKYSPKGGTVGINLNCEGSQIILQVSDSGIGIPPDDKTELFKSFSRASNVGTINGTGLGLSIVKKCVELHRGEVTLTSEVGVGTTFTVTLPKGDMAYH
jgi:signal transduction histidine kinase